MDMRFIEVGIGLTIVFAMASLLATAMMEAWSSCRSLRGRNLVKALVSFVGDDAKFARKLMRHPLMVSLSVGHKDESRCPSYITADVAVTSLLGMLVEHTSNGQRPRTPVEFVALLEKAVEEKASWAPDADFVRGLKSLTYGIEDDWCTYETRICAWYDAVGERSVDWYKRMVQLRLFCCGFAIALIGNINPLELAPSLWSSDSLRLQLTAAADTFLATRPPEKAEVGPEVVETLGKAVSGAKSSGLPIGWSVPFPPRQASTGCAWEHGSFVPGPAGCNGLAMVFNFFVVLVGWSITGIACTLGAPFWFDMLTKITKVRAANKPQPKTENKDAATPAPGLMARPGK